MTGVQTCALPISTDPRETQPAASEAVTLWPVRQCGRTGPNGKGGVSRGPEPGGQAALKAVLSARAAAQRPPLSGGVGQRAPLLPQSGARAGPPALPGSCSEEDTNLALAFLPPETPNLVCLGAKGGWLRPTGPLNRGKAPRGRREGGPALAGRGTASCSLAGPSPSTMAAGRRSQKLDGDQPWGWD